MKRKKISILGVTGSVGRTALKIIADNPDWFELVMIANNENITELKHLIAEYKPKFAVSTEHKYLYMNGKDCPYEDTFIKNPEAYLDCDIVLNGICGVAGLAPSIAVLRAGKVLATANKESFVAGGTILMNESKKCKSEIRPVDSEHSSIWQCIKVDKTAVEEVVLTASGGAFRDYSREQLEGALAKDALHHPNWVMGNKITVDCATLMNKGMEIIEAKHLFAPKTISVVRHDESIVHALVRLSDGSVVAHLSSPDMTVPIQYALTYPVHMKTNVKKLDFAALTKLSFSDIDHQNFPCLRIAMEVNELGDIAGCVMNAANEVLVDAYIKNMIGFYDIPSGIERAMNKFAIRGNFADIYDLFSLDTEVREYTESSVLLKRG